MVDRWQDGKSIGKTPDDEKKKKKKQVQFEVSEGKRGKPPVVIVEKGQIRLGEEDKKRSKQVTFEGSRPVVRAGPREVTPVHKATRPATLTGEEVEEGQEKLVLREEGQGTIEGTTPTRSRPKNKGNRVVFEAGGREGYRLGTIEVEYDGTDQDAKRIAEQIVRDADGHGLPYYNTESRLYITDRDGEKKAVINLPLRKDRIELDPWNKEANLPQSYVDIREKYASEKKKVSEPDPRDKTLILRLGNGTLDDAKAILKERMAQIKKLLPDETSYQIKKMAAADIMHQMFFEEKSLFKQDELDAMKHDPTTILKEASGIGYWSRIEKAAKLEFDYKTLGIKSIDKVKEQRPDLLVSDPLEALQIEYRQIQAKRRSKAYPVEEDQDNELKARQDELTKQINAIQNKKFEAKYSQTEAEKIEKEQHTLINVLTKTPEEKKREREEIEFREQEAERLNREAAEIASKAIKDVQEVQAEPVTTPAQEIARELSKTVEIPTTTEGAMVESPDQVKARQEAAEGVKFAQSGEDTVHAVSRKGNVGSVHVHEVNGKFYRYIHYRNAEGKSKADYDGPCEKDGTPTAGRRGKKTEEKKAEPKAEPKKAKVQEPPAGEWMGMTEANREDVQRAIDGEIQRVASSKTMSEQKKIREMGKLGLTKDQAEVRITERHEGDILEQGVESEPVVAGAFLQEQAEMIRAAARPEDREKVEKIIEQALVEESALTKTEAGLAFAEGMPVSRSQAYDARAEGWQDQVRGEVSRKRAISPLSGGPRHRLVSEVRVWDLKINPLSDQDAKRLLWKCDRCGEPVSYVYFVLDTEKSSDPSDSMGVGGTCCKVLTGKTPAQIKAGEREARAEQAASEATERRQGIKAEYILAHQDMIEDLEDMADEGADHYWPGARSMINWIEEKGTLSPAQEAFVNNIRNRKAEIVDYETYNLHQQLKEWIYYGFDMWAPMPLGRDNGFYSDVTKRAFGDGEREGVGLTKRQSDALFKLYDRHKTQVIERAIDMLDKDITNPQLLSTVEWLRRYVV